MSSPEWIVAARTTGGEPVRRRIRAGSREEVVAHLRRERLVPVSIHRAPRRLSLGGVGTARPQEVAVFTAQLATMVGAGLPLVQALDVLARQAGEGAFGETLRDVVRHVESGRGLASALGAHPGTFSRFYLSMVAAGEEGGVLDAVLSRLAGQLERSQELRRKLRGAMAYPATLLGFALVVMAALLTLVVPAFHGMLGELQQSTPLPTRLVLGSSELLRRRGGWLLAGTVAAAAGFRQWRGTASGRLKMDAVLLALPGIGDLIRKAAIARFVRTLGTLLEAGVSLLDALEITAATTGNRVLERAVLNVRPAIARGDSIAPPLERTGVFPPMVTRMIHVGESSGTLDSMLLKIADFYDSEVESSMASLLRLVEPALVVGLGLIIGGMIIAIYLPIFQLTTTIGG